MNGANQDEEEDWCWTRAKIEECIASRADIKHTKHTYKIPQIPFQQFKVPLIPSRFVNTHVSSRASLLDKNQK
jgi:hypothetical protein